MSRRVAVSIGLPVFNGGAHLSAALGSLLGQDFGDFELVISDNASTDGTREICAEFARVDRRVRYHRNEQTTPVLQNFKRVAQLATFDYFMWASHDDTWSSNYVGALLDGIVQSSTIVLSAGRTEYVGPDGELDAMPTDHAPPPEISGPEQLVSSLLEQHASSWFYGIFRTEVLSGLLDRLDHYPVWGGDILLLLHCCLNYDVVGNEAAVIYKRLKHHKSPFEPATARARTSWQLEFFAHMVKILVLSHLPIAQKWRLRTALQQYARRKIFARTVSRQLWQWGRTAVAFGLGKQ